MEYSVRNRLVREFLNGEPDSWAQIKCAEKSWEDILTMYMDFLEDKNLLKEE